MKAVLYHAMHSVGYVSDHKLYLLLLLSLQPVVIARKPHSLRSLTNEVNQVANAPAHFNKASDNSLVNDGSNKIFGVIREETISENNKAFLPLQPAKKKRRVSEPVAKDQVRLVGSSSAH